MLDNLELNNFIALQTALGSVGLPDDIGGALAIGVNLSQNPFQTSFPARGWKCCSLAALP
ncbi:MAG: hypothetical protein V7K48_25410 [Nostoc sp.]|uniref:hypothetical protein n=1 Tax=Nostoc sp. TaxID=1180 RepID=UPI002FFC7F29